MPILSFQQKFILPNIFISKEIKCILLSTRSYSITLWIHDDAQHNSMDPTIRAKVIQVYDKKQHMNIFNIFPYSKLPLWQAMQIIKTKPSAPKELNYDFLYSGIQQNILKSQMFMTRVKSDPCYQYMLCQLIKLNKVTRLVITNSQLKTDFFHQLIYWFFSQLKIVACNFNLQMQNRLCSIITIRLKKLLIQSCPMNNTGLKYLLRKPFQTLQLFQIVNCSITTDSVKILKKINCHSLSILIQAKFNHSQLLKNYKIIQEHPRLFKYQPIDIYIKPFKFDDPQHFVFMNLISKIQLNLNLERTIYVFHEKKRPYDVWKQYMMIPPNTINALIKCRCSLAPSSQVYQ